MLLRGAVVGEGEIEGNQKVGFRGRGEIVSLRMQAFNISLTPNRD